jgi:hypothetical protein
MVGHTGIASARRNRPRHRPYHAHRDLQMDDDLTMLIGPATDGAHGRSAFWISTATTRWSSLRCRCDRSSTNCWEEGEPDATHGRTDRAGRRTLRAAGR